MRLGFCFKPLRFYSTEPDSTVGFGIRRRHDFLSTVEEGLLGTPVGSQADSFPERISELESIKLYRVNSLKLYRVNSFRSPQAPGGWCKWRVLQAVCEWMAGTAWEVGVWWTRKHQRPYLKGAETSVAFRNRDGVSLSSNFKKIQKPQFLCQII